MVEEFLKRVQEYVVEHGGIYNQWYAGIAVDPKDRLFNGHSVQDGTDPWIHSEFAFESAVARNIEKILLAHGFNGGPGGADSNSLYVYAYKIASHTAE